MSTNEAIARLDAAVSALGDVDVSAWSEDTLRDQLGELSAALCALDALLARVADRRAGPRAADRGAVAA